MLGWGSTEGAIRAGARRAREAGHKVAAAQLRHLNPLPANIGDVLRSFERVLVPELNSGHLAMLLRSRFLVDVESYTKIQGQPLFASEMEEEIAEPPMSATLTKADFQSDQETRWCPGCGDYAVLSAVQQFMPELGIPPERIVFITGIGCAGRFAYYMDTYGMHGIHGRAPALATGLATSRDDLSIWVVSGDGDALSIGGNHLIHALRRNVPVKILLFNNQIYGLTKGQASPTSELGKITKSTPFGVADHPFNPVALALGAEATSSRGRSTATATTSPRCCAPPPPTRARRWSRSTRTARCSTTARSRRSPTRRPRTPTRSAWRPASPSASAPTTSAASSAAPTAA